MKRRKELTLKKGGSFLIEESAPEDVFTPEDFSEEQTMIRDMTEQFVEEEVLPQQSKRSNTRNGMSPCRLSEALRRTWTARHRSAREIRRRESRQSVRHDRCRETRRASLRSPFRMAATAGSARCRSFISERRSTKRKYLPLLCKAEKISAYALSEAGSGSDALAAKTNAVPKRRRHTLDD